jgi:hypothetical protein
MVLLVAVPIVYVVSFGPACWLSLRPGIGGRLVLMPGSYPVDVAEGIPADVG